MTDHEKITEKIIPEKLYEIEEKENVKIIYCVESGSRAWGFASPDSDYDVRFIYVRPKEFYLRLEDTKDVIEWLLDDTLDINGWDIQKMLRLLHKSNPTVFEWAASPTVYRMTPEWDEIANIIPHYFKQKSGMYHYLSTAKRTYREFLCGETVKLKKYFYALRPILACRYITERRSPPPMLFSELAEACLPSELIPTVGELIEKKMSTPEVGHGKRIDSLNDYIVRSIEELDSVCEALPKDEYIGWDELNRMFVKFICGR